MFERADAAALGRVQIERDGLVHEACVSELLGSTLRGSRITRLRCLFLHDDDLCGPVWGASTARACCRAALSPPSARLSSQVTSSSVRPACVSALLARDSRSPHPRRLLFGRSRLRQVIFGQAPAS